MPGLPRKNSEFLAMYRKDIEEIIKPYGFEYEDRDEYYVTGSCSAKEWREEQHIYFKVMPYGGIYLIISSAGRLSEFHIGARFLPAIQEVANIVNRVFGDISIKKTDNEMRWKNGGEGLELYLISNTHIMRDDELYKKTLMNISTNLDIYMSLTSPRKLFEFYKKYPNFYSSHFCWPGRTRLGYWLIMAKLAGEDYYLQYADEYVELNKDKIQTKFNVDITQLKEFLDTYTVGSLA